MASKSNNSKGTSDGIKRRGARRVSNLNLRLDRLEKERKALGLVLMTVDATDTDSRRLAAVERKLAKGYRMSMLQSSARTRAHNRGRNNTTVNVCKAMRRAEGGAFGKGKSGFGVDMERHQHTSTMEHQYKLKNVDIGTMFPMVAKTYTGTKNIHRNDVNFELMRSGR